MLANLGDDAIKQVNQHGPALLPFLNNYTDEGLQLINSSDEAAEFVLKHWDDAPEKVALAVDYGEPAMQLLETVDTTGAKKLLNNLSESDIVSAINLDNSTIDVLSKLEPDQLAHLTGNIEQITQIGPNANHLIKSMEPEKIVGFVKNLDADDIEKFSNLSDGAIEALGKWSKEDLVGFGSEIIQRAERDSNAIVLTNQLLQLDLLNKNSLDLDEAERLIKEIGGLSVNGSGDRFVIGNWIDYGTGFVADARKKWRTILCNESGSIYINK